IKTTEQAEELSRLPTIAAIPLIGSRELARRAKQGRWALGHYDPETVSLLPPPLQPPIMRYAIEEPTSIFAEAVRSIRLAVQRTARMQPLKTIMVTSAIDGEPRPPPPAISRFRCRSSAPVPCWSMPTCAIRS